MSKPPDGPDRTTDWKPVPEASGHSDTSGMSESIMETGMYGFAPVPAPPPPPTPAPAEEATGVFTKPDDLPKAFGRYEVQGFLGRGGFGTVYVGHDAQLDRKVAIKVPHGVAPERARQSFLNEARRLAQLRHPGIVAVYDIGVQDGHFYIVTDFLEGVSLRDHLKHGPLPLEEAVAIVARVADALMHAHAHRIIHRDVKPANIILTRDGQPVLLDFGLALSDVDGSRSDKRILGTPAYMSPEQAQGLGHRIDERTDIFSLGILLYRLFSGRLPFLGDTLSETLRQIVEDSPRTLRQYVPQLPAELERVCLKALAKRIEDRYGSAREFAEDLRQALRSQSTPMPSGGGATGAPPGPSVDSVTPTWSGARVRVTAEPERRRLTLLLCSCEASDLEAPLDQLDPEDQHNIQQAFHQYCADVVGRFGGTVIPSAGREVLVCFGYPLAFEDAPLRGVRTGLALVQDLTRLNERLRNRQSAQVTVWAAVHTGAAVVGAGDAAKGEPISIVGDVRTVTLRLEPLAEPGTVTITDTTYQQTRGFFVCESRGKHTVKGVAGPLEVFQVRGETAAKHRLEASEAGGLTPLVGRDTELSILRDRWEQAAEGMGQVVLLIGEAGLGKSRLVRELTGHVSQTSNAGELSVIEWPCSPYHQDSSLNPAKEYLSRLLRFEPHDPPAKRLHLLVTHLRQLKMDRAENVALFAALLSVPLDEHVPPLQLSPQRLRERTREVLLEWLDACVLRHPVLFVVEDLHWIDPSTLDLLNVLVERGQSERLLTLLTFRPEFETPWKSKAHQTQIALNRLTKRQIADMMRRKTGRDRLPQSVLDELAVKTDGIPLFVEEFAKVLVESAALQDEDGDSTASAVFKMQEIPASLEDLLMARLDRMACNREVVQLGSTLGREFGYPILRATCSLPEAELRAELEKLVQAELLFPKGRSPRDTFLFKHALIQDAAYKSMLKKRRQQYHRKIADVLAAEFPAEAEATPEVVAHHYAEAGLIAESLPYRLKAGQRAQATFANTEAIRHFTRGLELLATLEPSAARDEMELAFQVPLGVALFTERGYGAPEVGPVFARARELCLQVGDPARLFYVLWGNWAWRLVRSELEICRPLADEILALAESLNDKSFLAEAHFVPEVVGFYSGDFLTARTHGEKTVELQDPERCRAHAQGTGQNCAVPTRNFLSLAQWALGYPDRALALMRQSITLGKELGHPFTLSFGYHHIAWLMMNARLWAEALPWAEEGLALAADQGFKFWTASATIHKGVCLAQLGRSDEGLALIQPALAEYKGLGSAVVVPTYHALLGDVFLRRGQLDEALQSVEESLAWAYRLGQCHHEAEALRLKGEVLLARGAELVEAEGLFQQALAVARQREAKSWELRATLSLARLWERQGQRGEARAALAAVVGWFTEGFGTPDLVEAKGLLGAWA